MKLSVWAKENGLTYRTAWRMWRDGRLPVPAEQLATGTVLVHPPQAQAAESVALYARVSSGDQKADLERQLGRLAEYASREKLTVTRSVFEFRRQINYKAPMNSAHVVVADRWFPSSRLCNACGHLHAGLTLADREWVCDACGVVHDRDGNASNNLRDMAVSSTVTACGAGRAGPDRKVRTKRPAVKQEPTHGIFVHA